MKVKETNAEKLERKETIKRRLILVFGIVDFLLLIYLAVQIVKIFIK